MCWNDMKRWKTIKNCLCYNNSINGTMGFVEPMTRLTMKNSTLTAIIHYVLRIKKNMNKEAYQTILLKFFGLRVENMTDFFLSLSSFVFLTLFRLFTIYDAICPLVNGTKCWIHSIKCHYSTPSLSLSFCLRYVVKCWSNKCVRALT